MKKNAIIFMAMILAVSGAFCGGSREVNSGSAEAKSVTLFIAASTTDVMTDIAASFTEETGITVHINPASSGTLAKQLENGAPADVYVSASRKWMTYVNDLALTTDSSAFLKNRLVLIAPVDSSRGDVTIDRSFDFPTSFEGRLSMGDPAHVPAGQYGAESLTYYGWYDSLTDRIQPAPDVRSAMSIVELSEVEAGIVYETDAKKSEKVKILGIFPVESHTPVVYFCATLKDSEAPEEGAMLYHYFLESDKAKELYTKYGFTFFNE